MPSTADGIGGKPRQLHVIGDPMAGCRHCGAVIRTEFKHIVVYRAAGECCPSALQDQIIYAHEEIDQVNARLAAQETNLLRLRDELPLTEGRVREDALRRKLQRAEGHMPQLRTEAQAQLKEIGDRIRELRAKQEELGRNLGL